MLVVENNLLFQTVEDFIRKGTPVTLQVKGNSMLPFLRNERDLVEFHPFEEKELKRNAVILFRYNGSFVMHRIIKRCGEQLVMQGDGICKRTEHAAVSDVVAIVKNIIRVSFNGKQHLLSTQSLRWKICSQSWLLLSPFRKYLLAIYRRVILKKPICY